MIRSEKTKKSRSKITTTTMMIMCLRSIISTRSVVGGSFFQTAGRRCSIKPHCPSHTYRKRLHLIQNERSLSAQTQQEQQQLQQQSLSLLPGMECLQDSVIQVLNNLYDPKEVARGNAIAKFSKSSKKGSKSIASISFVQADNDDNATPERIQQQQARYIDDAVLNASPFGRSDSMVTPATKMGFGDYQCNAALGLAKALGKQPRDCALQIVDQLKPLIAEYMDDPEVAGPGFINIRFHKSYLEQALRAMAADVTKEGGRMAIPAKSARLKQKIVVDFSSPNIAKEMHVGHLRSTIIGDTLCNVLEFVGHDVVRLNHVGDWGTQFGMLVEHLRDACPAALDPDPLKAQSVDLGDLVTLYKAAKKRFDTDDTFKQRARQGVVELQTGNPQFRSAWKALCAASRKEYDKIYHLLNIHGLVERGESFYNQYLDSVVEELEKQGLAVESDGALTVFLNGYANRDGSPLPLIVRKSDGGFNYATTDLAAIRHRALLSQEESGEQADRVLYVTDAGQSQHFEMVYKVAKMAGFVPSGVLLEHVPFGLVQGEDGKKFASRSGETVKLKDLLNEAVRIAAQDLQVRNPDNTTTEFVERVDRVAKIVGIGAVKYADLSMNRESNYRFSYDRMLSLNGNTAPYMLYAYARICGIIRKASSSSSSSSSSTPSHDLTGMPGWPAAAPIILSHSSELELARKLVKLPDVISEVERDLYPNKICDFLFETSQSFNQFYEQCPVNKADTPELKASRLCLCTATAGTIRLLMSLLGIQVVEKL